MKTYSYLALGLLLAATSSSIYAVGSDDDAANPSTRRSSHSRGSNAADQTCQRAAHNDQLSGLLSGTIAIDTPQAPLVDKHIAHQIAAIKRESQSRTRQVWTERGVAVGAGALTVIGMQRLVHWYQNR
jgi:hypothetical protein